LHVSTDAAYGLFNFSVDAQAAVMGLNDIFYISAFIFIAIIPLIWITRPSKSSADSSNTAGAH
ncbi:EmrB/QacA family drug resistance transporter, partial [Burkholderia sp. SIMBA_013]